MNALSKALVVALLSTALPALAVTDCSKPKSKTDLLLCSNDRVWLADQIMTVTFRAAFNRTEDKDALLKEQEHWRETVRDACNDVPCLIKAYRDRTSELETY